MIDLEVKERVSRPAPEVYDFVVTNYFKNHPRWDPAVVRSELTSGSAIAVGATGVEVRKQMGRENTYNFRVTELTPDHVTFEATGGGAKSFGADWTVRPASDGSEVTIRFRLAMGGLMAFFEPMMKGSVRKEMTQAASRIKQLVEASPVDVGA